MYVCVCVFGNEFAHWNETIFRMTTESINNTALSTVISWTLVVSISRTHLWPAADYVISKKRARVRILFFFVRLLFVGSFFLSVQIRLFIEMISLKYWMNTQKKNYTVFWSLKNVFELVFMIEFHSNLKPFILIIIENCFNFQAIQSNPLK